MKVWRSYHVVKLLWRSYHVAKLLATILEYQLKKAVDFALLHCNNTNSGIMCAIFSINADHSFFCSTKYGLLNNSIT